MNNLPDFGTGKTILIAPLNWGLGHATRLIQIVRHYKPLHHIILAGNEPSISVLTQQFPDLKAIELSKQIFYFDRHFFSPINILRFNSRLKKSIRNDYKAIKVLIVQHKIDIIISDNRYGLRHPDTYNILITHQLMLKLPSPWSFLENMVHRNILRKIRKFDACWVPDFSGKENLSGDLSHRYPLPENVKFINPLSRFQNIIALPAEKNKKVLAILSGPEPQRNEFEKKLEQIFINKNITATILLGKPNLTKSTRNNLLTKLPNVTDDEFINLVRNHTIILARAGYSTIMDFYFLQIPIVLVPTPKQTEQMYLAQHLKNHPLFTFVEEKDLENYLVNC